MSLLEETNAAAAHESITAPATPGEEPPAPIASLQPNVLKCITATSQKVTRNKGAKYTGKI